MTLPVSTCFLEQSNRPVDRGDGDSRIELAGALVKFLDIGMVVAFGQYPRDDPALLGYAQAAFGAKGFDVDWLMQVRSAG
jgi:hypothetical protein